MTPAEDLFDNALCHILGLPKADQYATVYLAHDLKHDRKVAPLMRGSFRRRQLVTPRRA